MGSDKEVERSGLQKVNEKDIESQSRGIEREKGRGWKGKRREKKVQKIIGGRGGLFVHDNIVRLFL